MKTSDVSAFKKYFPIIAEVERCHPDHGNLTIELTWHGGKLTRGIISERKQTLLLKEDKNVGNN
jgi:hypothetical protein